MARMRTRSGRRRRSRAAVPGLASRGRGGRTRTVAAQGYRYRCEYPIYRLLQGRRKLTWSGGRSRRRTRTARAQRWSRTPLCCTPLSQRRLPSCRTLPRCCQQRHAISSRPSPAPPGVAPAPQALLHLPLHAEFLLPLDRKQPHPLDDDATLPRRQRELQALPLARPAQQTAPARLLLQQRVRLVRAQ